jgi:hypothetical protein
MANSRRDLLRELYEPGDTLLMVLWSIAGISCLILIVFYIYINLVAI